MGRRRGQWICKECRRCQSEDDNLCYFCTTPRARPTREIHKELMKKRV